MLRLVVALLGALAPTRLETMRDRFHLRGLVQIHHIYPRQFRNHPVLRHYDVDDASNLMYMPTRAGVEALRTRPDRLVHDGGHPSYYRYVGKYLEHVAQMPPVLHPILLNNTQKVLRGEMRRHTFVPWE